MKKFVLFFGLGLGLLVPQEGFSAKAYHPCSDNGYCYIHNATDQRMYVFDNKGQWIKGINGDYWIDGLSPKGFRVPEDSFPITLSACQKLNQNDKYCKSLGRHLQIQDAHCYTFWRVLTATDPWDLYKYWTTRWPCAWESTGKPPSGTESPKSTSKPSPLKPGKPAK